MTRAEHTDDLLRCLTWLRRFREQHRLADGPALWVLPLAWRPDDAADTSTLGMPVVWADVTAPFVALPATDLHAALETDRCRTGGVTR